MWKLTTSTMIVIIVLITFFQIALPEPGKREGRTTIIGDAGSEKIEGTDGHSHDSVGLSVMHCYENLGVEVHFSHRKLKGKMETPDPDNTRTIEEPRRSLIRELDTNINGMSSENFGKARKQIVEKLDFPQDQIFLPTTEKEVNAMWSEKDSVESSRNHLNPFGRSNLATQSNTSNIDIVENPGKIQSARATTTFTSHLTGITHHSIVRRITSTEAPTLRLLNSLARMESIKIRKISPSSTFQSITQAKSDKLILFAKASDSSTTYIPSGPVENQAVQSNHKNSPVYSTASWQGTQLTSTIATPRDIPIDNEYPHFPKSPSKPPFSLVHLMPSKIFHEIKPSLNTVGSKNDARHTGTNAAIIPVTKRNSLTDFKLSEMTGPIGKYGPYFIDEVDYKNVTGRIGSTVILDCKIGLLGDKKVTWLQHDKQSIRLLTVGNVQYSADERISLKFQYPNNWRLQITYAALRDSGLYKCQVEIDSMHSLVKRYNLVITAPILNITDDSGRPIYGERHLKSGSTLRLRCEGWDVLVGMNETLVWTRGDETLTSEVSDNRTTVSVEGKEIPVIVIILVVERASSRHAGNYTCLVPEKARTTIAIHVLDDEETREVPAAVHDGNGVTGAIINFWLVHLFLGSGLFR